MKLFGKDGLRLDLTTVLITVVLTLVIFQGFGLVFNRVLGLEIYLGPLFIVLPLAISGVLGVAIVKKMVQDMPVTSQDIFAMAVTTILALLVLFLLRDFVPEIFSGSLVELQSVIGFK